MKIAVTILLCLIPSVAVAEAPVPEAAKAALKSEQCPHIDNFKEAGMRMDANFKIVAQAMKELQEDKAVRCQEFCEAIAADAACTEQLCEKYNALQIAYDKAVAEIAGLKKEITDRRAEINSLKAALAKQSATIIAQQNEITGLKKTVAERNATIAERDSTIATLNGKIDAFKMLLTRWRAAKEALGDVEADMMGLDL